MIHKQIFDNNTFSLGKGRKAVKAIVITICLNLFVCSITGCSKAAVDNRTSNTQNADVLLENSEIKHQEEDDFSDIYGDKMSDGSVDVDITKLPSDLRRMVPLCEAVVLSLMDSGMNYSCNSPYLVWHCIHLAMVNSGWKEESVQMNGDRIVSNAELVRDYMFAMFGELDETPSIPETLSSPDENNKIQIAFNNNLDYTFNVGDMESGYTEILKVIYYPDATVDMAINIKDYSGNEIASFVFKLQGNTRDTGMAATFHYEIIDAYPNDELTSRRLMRMPYIVENTSRYGSNIRDKENRTQEEILANPKGNTIEEILNFDIYGEMPPPLVKLNDRISEELVHMNDDENSLWHEIRSYGSENDKYIQILTTYYTYSEDTVTRKILTYNYDIAKRMEINKKSAAKLSDLDENELEDLFNESIRSVELDGEIINTEYTGFILKGLNSVDYYFSIMITAGEKSEEIVAKYDVKTDEITIYENEEDIADSDYFDVDTISLTHGR